MPLNESRNAIELLKHDHREVESLFAQMESETSDERKLELGRSICIELTVHAQIEEELFYPAAKQALPDDRKDLIGEATVEHASLKQLIADIDGSAPGDELFEARFKVLKEYVQHHVKEEEKELMPEVERTEIDLESLGETLAERKQDLKDALEGSGTGSRRARRISLPKPRARRGSTGTRRRATTKRGGASAGKKRAPARKRAAAASRQSAPKARKSAASKGTSARKRTQTRRARSGRG